MTDTPPLINPIESADPAALVALFDADPTTIPDASLDALIGEYRRRADVAKAEAAAAQAAPKTPRKKAARDPGLTTAAVADKPVAELTVDDLLD